ncbi:hypothetical protein [Treponema phagedenis]|uniref:hypothetical protein n=1 Tax=Treponema phagedenis TaxID=162 RepID=UPI0002EC276D|nr:hypothetical protein [Treponema phagedenis]TYT79267.1 tetratricopeptide repeat protein [Treponema phagedenis]
MKRLLRSVFVVFFILGISFVSAQDSAQAVNAAAALKHLQSAAENCAQQKWQEALFQAQLGSVYDAKLADLPYIEALCYTELGYTRAAAIERAELASSLGMMWRLYDATAINILLAKLYTETLRYDEALAVLADIPYPSADSDFYTAVALYGLKRFSQAEDAIVSSLNRWAFDSRFPKLFFLQEKDRTPSAKAKRIASDIISKLYVWQDSDPEVLLYAVDFEPNTKEAVRKLKIYLNMYAQNNSTQEPYAQAFSILAALKYGIINEKTAVERFFNLTLPFKFADSQETPYRFFFTDLLVDFCKLIGDSNLRKQMAADLSTFNGVLVTDDNRDGIISSKILYTSGRPQLAEFDTDQDGIAEYTIDASYGTPTKIIGKAGAYEVDYDTYPWINTVKTKKGVYTLRPVSFAWKPVEQRSLNINLFSLTKKYTDFFTLKTKNVSGLSERELIFAAAYYEYSDDMIEGAITKTYFDKGVPISSETRINEIPYSVLYYVNGRPSQKKIDRDGDGYFETIEKYSPKGKLQIVLTDINKNKLYEYSEEYLANGDITKKWDNDEDGTPEIVYTQFKSGNAQCRWTHPVTRQKVIVEYKQTIPAKLTANDKAEAIIKDTKFPLYWIRKPPVFSETITKKILEVFNETKAPVVSYFVEVNTVPFFAVRSGGYIFVEQLEEMQNEPDNDKI